MKRENGSDSNQDIINYAVLHCLTLHWNLA